MSKLKPIDISFFSAFNKDACIICGACFHECPVMQLPIDDSIIEMTECSIDKLSQCIYVIFTDGFNNAQQKYHEKIRMNFRFYFIVIVIGLLKNKKFKETLISLNYTLKRWFFDALLK